MKDRSLERLPADHFGDQLLRVSLRIDFQLVGDDPASRSAYDQIDLAYISAVFKVEQQPLRVNRAACAADSDDYRFHLHYSIFWRYSRQDIRSNLRGLPSPALGVK